MKIFRFIPVVMLLSLFFGGTAISNAQSDSNSVIWNSTFYNNSYLGEPAVLSRQDRSLSFDWGNGSPNTAINSDYFSARFTTSFNFQADFYRFRVIADDGIRVIIDNSITLIDTFDNPQPNETLIADADMSSGIHTVQVDYREVTGLARLQLGWVPISNPGTTQYIPPSDIGVNVINTGAISPSSDWTATYYANNNLSGTPSAILTESTPSHNWGTGSPLATIPADNFSARWRSSVYLSGIYDITVRADDGVRVYVNDQLYIDEWHPATNATYRARFTVPEGNHRITVEYYEAGGVAFLDYDLTSASAVDTSPITNINPARQWLVQYYDNAGLVGDPVLIQSEDRVSRTWGTAHR